MTIRFPYSVQRLIEHGQIAIGPTSRAEGGQGGIRVDAVTVIRPTEGGIREARRMSGLSSLLSARPGARKTER